MRNQFSHASAWAIVALLMGGLAAGSWWQSCYAAAPQSAQARRPAVEIVPEDRPDRHGFDDGAYADEMNSATRRPVPFRGAAGRLIVPQP